MQVSADAGAGVVVRGLVHVLSAGTGAGVVVQGLVRVLSSRGWCGCGQGETRKLLQKDATRDGIGAVSSGWGRGASGGGKDEARGYG